jgi:NADH-quinone oxidoreductase subunit J
MEPVATPFFFYFLSALAVASGIVVITRRNPVHSALALIVTLLSLAGLYLMLYAPFVAGVQIILYAGGITVLFLFVIMLVNVEKAEQQEQFNRQWHLGIGVSVLLGALFLVVYLRGRGIFPPNAVSLPEQTNVQQVALTLYREYLLPFEIASVLLLVAIVGAVVMAKKRV